MAITGSGNAIIKAINPMMNPIIRIKLKKNFILS